MIPASANAGSRISCLAAPAMPPRSASLAPNYSRFGLIWMPDALGGPVVGAIASRVENRRSNCSLPVVNRLGFRRATSVRFGLVLFPVPAHRTGQADFPHPALGKDTRGSV